MKKYMTKKIWKQKTENDIEKKNYEWNEKKIQIKRQQEKTWKKRERKMKKKNMKV